MCKVHFFFYGTISYETYLKLSVFVPYADLALKVHFTSDDIPLDTNHFT